MVYVFYIVAVWFLYVYSLFGFVMFLNSFYMLSKGRNNLFNFFVAFSFTRTFFITTNCLHSVLSSFFIYVCFLLKKFYAGYPIMYILWIHDISLKGHKFVIKFSSNYWGLIFLVR